MSRDEQIEEMAKDFCAVNIPCEECHLYKNGCHAKKYATRAYNAGYRKASDVAELEEKLADVTANWQKIHDAYDADCIEHYNKGRSEVAREIIAIIEQLIISNEYKSKGIGSELWKANYSARKEAFTDIKNVIKKKYTEDENDNGQR